MNEIQKRPWSVWDGASIYRTKDCDGCIYYRNINEYEICGAGLAFKYLTEREGPRKCTIIKRVSSTPSVSYLDEIMKDIEKSNTKT